MPDKLSLTELQLIIRDSLYMSFPDFYWVTAEISELKENTAGHCYMEIVEKSQDDKNVRARARAIIWNTKYRFLKAFFENSTNESLREGIKILIRVKIEYHELYGLSLVVTDIDPAFTIGDIAIKRQMIIKRLEEEGVFTMNKGLEFPLLPRRIAVISSRNAAGYTDFIRHLAENEFGYIFHTYLVESALQGSETETGIISALDKVAANQGLFDIVVIIRGGGSQSDLSWFDNYNIAYHITQFPLPVITGIGHEKDVSVTDMVAYMALKTPTAVADMIINSYYDAENHLNELAKRIVESSSDIMKDYWSRIDYAATRLYPISKIMIADVRDKLSARTIELSNKGKNYIFNAVLRTKHFESKLVALSEHLLAVKNKEIEGYIKDSRSFSEIRLTAARTGLNSLQNSLQLLDPSNVLARGYTITSSGGKILRSSMEAETGQMVDTLFKDGTISSKVVGVKKQADKE